MIGLVVGFYTRLHPVLTGLAVITLPILAIIYELITFPTSHNLFPFEIGMYLVFGLPAVVGVFVGRILYNRKILKAR